MSEVSLKEHLETQLRTLQTAIDKAENQLNTRLIGMNEFRDALRDQTLRLITRTEYDFRHGSIEEKVRHLELSQAASEGRSAVISTVVSIATSLVVGVVTFVITHYVIGK